MSRRVNSVTTLTPTATADTAALANGTYPHCIQPGSSTQQVYLWEISINGQAASSSSPTFMLLSYDSTVGTGTQSYGSNGTDSQMNQAFQVSGTVPGTGNVFITTQPQRSATQHLLNCSVNAFGGVYFWRANRLEECPSATGNTQPYGSVSLSAFTGGTPGLLGSHIIYETV